MGAISDIYNKRVTYQVSWKYLLYVTLHYSKF